MLKRTLIVLILFLSLGSCSKKVVQEQAAKPLYIKFEQAKAGPISQEFETAGELKADKEILVSAERQGQVQEVYVYEGQWVQAGEALIKVKGEDVDADLKKVESDYNTYSKLYKEGAIARQDLLKYETELNRFKSQKDNLLIRAKTSGSVGVIHVDPGDYVKLGDKVLDLVKLDPLRVSYSIPERLIAKVQVGQAVTLTTDSEADKVFNAVVDFISPRVDPETRTVVVRAKISNPSTKLKANQFVKVKQVISDLQNTLLVREEAVYLDQGQEYLYLAESGKGTELIAKRVAVKTGLRQNGNVQILEGIKAGDKVIYAGLHSIYPGANLVVAED
jgi:RND family efflux transporter MFP subunit